MKKLLLPLLLILSACSISKPLVVLEAPQKEDVLKTSQGTTPGYDVLGLAQYCDVFLKAPKLPATSVLFGNGKKDFGDNFPCLEKRIAQGGVTKIQIDLVDATCHRNKVCPAGTAKLPAYSAVRARARVVNVHANLHPEIEWGVSPWLEHDFKDSKIVQRGCAEVASGCPTCKCINSPMSGVKPAGIPVELHGTKSSSFATSADGSSIFDGDNLKNDGNKYQFRTSGSDQTYAWWNELNQRCTGEDKFTPIVNRRVLPELWQFQVAHKIMTTEEDPVPANFPAQCTSVRKVSGKEISKTFSEKYCNGTQDDGRGSRGLLILNRKGKAGEELPVFSPSGEKVACYKYFGPYSEPKLYRYYIGTCSKETPWDLYKELGQEWGYVGLGNNKCLLVNSIRRMGGYR